MDKRSEGGFGRPFRSRTFAFSLKNGDGTVSAAEFSTPAGRALLQVLPSARSNY
jgi:hypothetical protein